MTGRNRLAVFLLLLSFREAPLSALPPPSCVDLFTIEAEVKELLSSKPDPFSGEIDEEVFKDLLDFEQRVLKFLSEVPAEIFDSIGVNFATAGLSDQAEQESFFSKSNIEFWRREIVLKKSVLAIPQDTWESVARFYADQELYRFLIVALTRLPVGTQSIKKKMTLDHAKRASLLFWKKHINHHPSFDSMFSASPSTRSAFARAARIKDKSFNMDLTAERNYKIALKMLHEKRFGRLDKFAILWLIEIYRECAKFKEEAGVAGIDIDSFYSRRVEDQVTTLKKSIQEEAGWADMAVFNFVNRFVAYLSHGNPTYRADEVRMALTDALEEHHSVLKELISEQRQSSSEPETLNLDFQYVHKFVYEPSPVAAEQRRIDESRLEFYVSGELPIENLKPDSDYKVVFKNNYGRRRKVHLVRFTPRAIDELQRWHRKKFHGLTPKDWMKAIQAGFAAPFGEPGLKLLRTSPISALRHLRIEVKLLGAGTRWLGYLDEEGRYVFDLFHNDHS